MNLLLWVSCSEIKFDYSFAQISALWLMDSDSSNFFNFCLLICLRIKATAIEIIPTASAIHKSYFLVPVIVFSTNLPKLYPRMTRNVDVITTLTIS